MPTFLGHPVVQTVAVINLPTNQTSLYVWSNNANAYRLRYFLPQKHTIL